MKPRDSATLQDTDSATAVLDSTGTGGGWDSQVILFNDDVNTFDDVIAALMGVFGHTEPLAEAIAFEAHNTGRAIAEVEPRPDAEKHAAELTALGLRASVESV
jgi:ATP-dependent Clp protease adaptor protein ClpS